MARAPGEVTDPLDEAGDRGATLVLVSRIRWIGIVAAVVLAFLTSNPPPIGGIAPFLGISLIGVLYNIPASRAGRLTSRRTLHLLELVTLAGDFSVCTAWTLLTANDRFSASFATFSLVAIYATVLFRWRGTIWFGAAFIAVTGLLSWERLHFFGYRVVWGHLVFRTTVVLLLAIFLGAITDQSYRRLRMRLRSASDLQRESETTALRTEQHQSLLQALSDLGEGVITVREDRIVDANDAYCRLTGYTLEELRALETSLLVVNPNVRRSLEENRNPRGSRGDTLLRTKSGKEVPVEWATIHLGSGSDERIVAVIRDLSERAENLRLLEKARDEAETANAAKTEYLSRMNHELRTPLTAIIGFAELLDMGGPRPDQRDAVHSINVASEHLLQLVDDVLDISRIESGVVRMPMTAVAVGDLVGECLELAYSLARKRGVIVSNDIPARGEVFVRANGQQLKQILLNLLSNSVKYNREGGEVRVSVHADQRQVHIAVTDTGIGIPADECSHIFEPFHRLDAARSGIAGTGLGLALSKRLAESMSGSITLESELGKGSTFTVHLRRARAPKRDVAGGNGHLEGVRVHGRERSIVFVDDSPANIDLIGQIIEMRSEWRFTGVTDAATAMDVVRDELPDLVLLDLHMPALSGEEMLEMMRSDPQLGDIPVVILTADATRDKAEQLVAAGARAYLTKPIRPRDFMRTLEQFLSEEVPGGETVRR